MDSATRSVFAYGTLELPELMEALTGRRFARAPARLDGYARGLLRGRPYPGIVPRAGAHTDGTVYACMDAASLALLDRFEGDLYERRSVALCGGDDAEAYVLRPAHAALLTSRPWQRDAFVARHLPRYLAACHDLRARSGA